MKLDNTMRCLPKMIWLQQKTVIDVTHTFLENGVLSSYKAFNFQSFIYMFSSVR